MDTSIPAMFGLLLLALAGVVACFNLNRVINYIAQICEWSRSKIYRTNATVSVHV